MYTMYTIDLGGISWWKLMKIILKSNENSLIQVIGGRGHIMMEAYFKVLNLAG